CCIYAAIIRLKRNFARFGHLPVSDLMQDFPRLRIPGRHEFAGLAGGQEAKDAAGNIRSQPQGLESRDDPIPSENRVVPRYAGVWVIALGSGGEERKEVVPRALYPVVELFVAGSDDSHFSFALFERRLHAIQCIGVVFEKKRRSARLEDNGGVDGKV